MLEELKKQVCQANLDLVSRGLVIETFGNVSGIDRAAGCAVIKPSGAAYSELKPRDMVVVSFETGAVVEGSLRPSSDTPTHLALYQAFEAVGGIVHTHALYSTAWAQSRRDIPPLGTTHADYFLGPVPCTRLLTGEEIKTDYEANTGKVIVERLADMDPMQCLAVLVADHGPFVWGRSPAEAVDTAVALEFVARLAAETHRMDPYPRPVSRELLERHFYRKHGPGRYYGQDR